MLEAKDLRKVYKNGAKELPVLKGISFKVRHGEIVSIVGPSGAGKSTLLHILGGLDKPTQGAVSLGGSDIYRLADKELALIRNEKIGFVFQFYHLFSEFNVLENILLPAMCSRAKIKGTGLEEKAETLLKHVGLEKRKTHLPSELSGGEQQRVAIARALINSPEILFCDEPTGNLDSKTGNEVVEMLKKLNKENNMTIVLVTHNEEVAKIAGTRLYLKDGLLVN
ncbi:MAG: ABC transporter ATP-binding protein [Candidatus Omnitrophica bacterium]|nr:ABC transporter ATP-binding protein [Candidatus Omnitrophota bacterium]MDD5237225.1 ABC transporter ATP-binding protein [Candidatus Omnitrophota bacterium]MDD5610115.1 ABC transporter ATP-binding protein [Candidatus Omnitrophota bacterium]